ncbi:MAG: hypothetical protein JXA21_03035 [Anaerolineae bacterium]|nr:hypothetical protein [Anaerolineae bacterium]
MTGPLTPKLQSRLEATFERIAGDPGVTSDLLDDAARVLLNWAQEEVSRMVLETAEMDDDEADAVLAPKLQLLRKYLRRTAHVCAANAEPAESLRQRLSSPEYSTEDNPDASKDESPQTETTPPQTEDTAPAKESCTLCNLRVMVSSGFRRLFSKSSDNKGGKQ